MLVFCRLDFKKTAMSHASGRLELVNRQDFISSQMLGIEKNVARTEKNLPTKSYIFTLKIQKEILLSRSLALIGFLIKLQNQFFQYKNVK